MSNREILFKAKTVITETFKQRVWVYGLFHKVCDKYYMFGYLNVEAYDMSEKERLLKKIFPRVYEVEPETICQFTNLKDKNNVKIFEKDVVRFYNYFKTGDFEDAVIGFENGSFVGKGKITNCNSDFTMYLYPYISKGEVIADI